MSARQIRTVLLKFTATAISRLSEETINNGVDYNRVMARATQDAPAKGNGRRSRPAVSEVGKELTRISRLIEKSGAKMLTRREIEREVAERRGAR